MGHSGQKEILPGGAELIKCIDLKVKRNSHNEQGSND